MLSEIMASVRPPFSLAIGDYAHTILALDANLRCRIHILEDSRLRSVGNRRHDRRHRNNGCNFKRIYAPV
jgi:hypothetical protein